MLWQRYINYFSCWVYGIVALVLRQLILFCFTMTFKGPFKASLKSSSSFLKCSETDLKWHPWGLLQPWQCERTASFYCLGLLTLLTATHFLLQITVYLAIHLGRKLSEFIKPSHWILIPVFTKEIVSSYFAAGEMKAQKSKFSLWGTRGSRSGPLRSSFSCHQPSMQGLMVLHSAPGRGSGRCMGEHLPGRTGYYISV